MSGIWLPDGWKLAINWKKDNDVTIYHHDAIVDFFIYLFIFDVVMFVLWSLVTGSSFMSISWLFLELWQFLFIKDWSIIWKSEILMSEFYTISGGLGWARDTKFSTKMSLVKCYWMLQNARATTFAVSELLRENQQEREGDKITPTALKIKMRV